MRKLTDAEREATLERLGREIIGPVLVRFARWHLDLFAARGVDTVLYIAREGRLMLDVANAAFPPRPADSARVYARLSRRIAWGTLIDDPGKVFATRVGRSRIRTVRAALDTVPFHPDLKAAILSHADLALESNLDRDALARLRAATRAHADRVADDVGAQRRRLASFVRALGVGDAPIGIVDIGWSCTIQDAIVGALGDAGEAHGAYLGVHAKAQRTPSSTKQGFVHDPRQSGPAVALLEAGGALRALETVLSSGERSAYRLVDTPSGVEAELAPYGPGPRIASDRSAIHRGAIAAALELGPRLSDAPEPPELARNRAHEAISELVEHPAPDLADAILGMSYVQDVGVGAEEAIGWSGVSEGTAWYPALVAKSAPAQRALTAVLSFALAHRRSGS